jgi:hypothetical protein
MAAMTVGLDAYATLDSTTWAALALVLTILGLVLSWVAWRRRGLAAGLRGLAWSLLPLAAWLTGTLKLVASIANDVTSWAVHVVFSPVVWTGVALFGVSVGLFLLSGMLRGRGAGHRDEVASPSSTSGGLPAGSTTKAVSTGSTSGGRRGRARSSDDIEGMDEIEAILKKHGI